MHEPWQGLFARYVSTSFVDLLRQQAPDLLTSQPPAGGTAPRTEALRRAGGAHAGRQSSRCGTRTGVIVAGDRQATEGYQVAHRRIEKVYKTDEHSVIAIAGAAGPAIEMARLFQTELEHYEKVEGDGLSLEGKANKLGHMIRMNLPMAMQGLVVVPIFAGYDLRRAEGRIFKYDVTGGRYEETDYFATGSGGKDARNTPEEAVPGGRLARGGAPLDGRGARGRGGGGRRDGRPRLRSRDLPERDGGHARRIPGSPRSRGPCPVRGRGGGTPPGVLIHAAPLLRLARADDEGQGRVCPEGHRSRSVPRRPRVPGRHPAGRREPVDAAPQDLGDLRPDRVRGGRQVQRVREPADRRGSARRPQGLLLLPGGRDREGARQRLLPGAREHLHRGAQAVRGGDPGRRACRRRQRQERDVPYRLRWLDRGRAQLRGDGRPGGGDPPVSQGALPGGDSPSPRRCGSGSVR